MRDENLDKDNTLQDSVQIINAQIPVTSTMIYAIYYTFLALWFSEKWKRYNENV